MLESELEKRFCRLVRLSGGMTRKFNSTSRRGVPDQVVIWPPGIVHFVELKTEKGRLTALQKSEHDKFRAFGGLVFTLYGSTDVECYIAENQQ